jgi:hypothetical protein
MESVCGSRGSSLVSLLSDHCGTMKWHASRSHITALTHSCSVWWPGQCYGFGPEVKTGNPSEKACARACCEAGQACEAWQWRKDKGCFMGGRWLCACVVVCGACSRVLTPLASLNRSAAKVAVCCSGVALLAATNDDGGVGCGVMFLLALSTALTPQAWGLR